MNKKVFLSTTTSVTLLLFVLFCVGCALDESSHEAQFDKITGPIVRVLATPISQLFMLIFGKTASGFRSLLILALITVGSGIFWGFIVERIAHWLGQKRRETRIVEPAGAGDA